MAINTDAEFERSVVGESGVGGGGAAEFRDTQKLLGVVVSDGKDALGSCSDSRRPSVRSLKSLNADQNSYKSTGTGSVESPPHSPAPELNEPEPRTYMWLALFSCFCPALPLNAIALYFAHAVSLHSYLNARCHTLGVSNLLNPPINPPIKKKPVEMLYFRLCPVELSLKQIIFQYSFFCDELFIENPHLV